MAHQSSPQPKYDFVAYIDEAGDDGLATVKPLDKNGSSEWLVLGAVVIDAAREAESLTWVRDIIKDFSHHQGPGLHFRNLNSAKKRLACASIATRPLRCFALASNKKNMKGYSNPWAELIPSKNWFYCWLTRLLLERVTYFAKQRGIAQHGEPRKLKIIYSERGGMSYAQLDAYFSWLKLRSDADQLVLPLGDLQWEVMDRNLLEVHNHSARAGLQLADVVASAFFKAADIYDTRGCDPQFAKLLEPRMGRDPDTQAGKVMGYGVKLMPKWSIAKLRPEQQAIFRFYGYPGTQWWMPR